MKTRLLALSALLLAAGCAATRPEARLTSEPSVERAMDIINSAPDGRRLIKFLNKHPVRFEYSNTPGRCAKFALDKGYIYIPEDYRDSDLVAALAIARAGYIYRLHVLSGLDEIISDEEELGALFQFRLALDLNVVNADFDRAGGAPEIKNYFCAYVLENSRYAMQQARQQALTPDTACQRPLETLENQKIWLEKTRQAIDDQTFYQLLYERDLARVRKGSMTMNEAMKRDANVRALPVYEVYRFQRSFYDRQSGIFDRIAKLYSKEVRADAAWRASHKAAIDRARAEFSDCNLP